MQDVGQFIEQITVKTIRRHTGVLKSAPTEWKTNGAIPAKHFPAFEFMCAQLGIECPRRFFGFAGFTEK